jgi:hypothetical protein
MQPKNDHEEAIAKAIDAKLLEDPDRPIEITLLRVACSMGFLLSKSDTAFLADYAKMKFLSRRKAEP